MEKIRIDTGQLKSTAEAVSKALQGAEKNTEAIKSACDRLDTMWEGEAKSSFKTALSEDIASVSGTLASLRSIVEFETEAASSYEECEMKVIEEASAAI